MRLFQLAGFVLAGWAACVLPWLAGCSVPRLSSLRLERCLPAGTSPQLTRSRSLPRSPVPARLSLRASLSRRRPWKVVPFPQVELQSRWVAYVLSGAAALPPRADMEAHAAAFYASLAAAGTAQRYTHRMAGSLQWDYSRWLAQQCGEAEAEAVAGSLAWREQLYSACGNSRKLNAASYRDAPLVGADEALAAAAEEAARVRQRLAAAVATA